MKFKIAGSYRRNKKTSRDIDIILSSGNFKDKSRVWNKFCKQLNFVKNVQVEHVFAQGDSKISVMIKFTRKKTWMLKTDVFIAKPEEYPFMLLYATGSGDFNILMRSKAKKQNLILNQKGLFKNDSRIPAKNEREIFEKLNMKYRTPNNREIFFKN